MVIKYTITRAVLMLFKQLLYGYKIYYNPSSSYVI